MKALPIFFLLLLVGCATSPMPPIKGGHASVTRGTSTAPAQVAISQPDNPAAVTEQTVKEDNTETFIFPVATTIVTEVKQPDGSSTVVTENVPAGTKKISVVRRDTVQKIGAAQKDTSREIAAKLASFKPVQYIGVVILLAAASMFHPVVRVALGVGKDMQMATAATGAALIFGPTLFVGNEKLILIGGIAVLLALYLFSRSSYAKGVSDTKKT